MLLPHRFPAGRYLLALVALGVLCGLIGAAFTLVLSTVEHFAFGFTTGTFAEAVTQVSPSRRLLAVLAAGALVAVLWYLLRRRGPAIPSPSAIYGGQRVGAGWMALDTTLQVANVAAGGSIGREGAPRQGGALGAAGIARLLGLDDDLCRLLIACGAGAGLAAIYNVPVGGALFAAEVVIGLRALRRAGAAAAAFSVVSALAVAWLATLVARIAVPARPTYSVEWPTPDGSLLLLALLIGPLVGAAGYGFGVLMERASARAPQGRAILWTMPLCYLLLAALALPLPLVLGNGHALAQNAFGGELLPLTAALLIVAKPLATLLTVRAGATGGRLTPSLSTGAAIGVAVAAVCPLAVPAPAVALLAAGAFLAGAMRAPLTAAVLAIEFTGAGAVLWPLVALVALGAYGVDFLLTRLR